MSSRVLRSASKCVKIDPDTSSSSLTKVIKKRSSRKWKDNNKKKKLKRKRKKKKNTNMKLNQTNQTTMLEQNLPSTSKGLKTETTESTKEVDKKPNLNMLKRSHDQVNNNKKDIKRIKLENNKVCETVPKKSKHSKLGWIEERLVEKENINQNLARSLIKLFEDGNTIPFMARYRKHLTGDMLPDKLRDLKSTYDSLCQLKVKCDNALKALEKSGYLTPKLTQAILNCRSMSEFEHIYEPFKQTNRKSLAERAKNLGLEETAVKILQNTEKVDLYSLVQTNGPEGLKTIVEVEKGVLNIMGHHIIHDTQVLDYIRERRKQMNLRIVTKVSVAAKKGMDKNALKFEYYCNKTFFVNNIKPHQILAINRAENLKYLTAKIVIPDFFQTDFKNFCFDKWLVFENSQCLRTKLFFQCVTEIYSKNVRTLISRKTKADLKEIAHEASREVFASNLKQCLLETPVKGKVIMGIDPAYQTGCKVAVISVMGDVLDTSVIFPCIKKSEGDKKIIRELLLKHRCTTIALGNGKGCRETESWLTNLIKSQYFHPLDVTYTIVSENGVSVYSVSEQASKEFPNLTDLEIGAVSLARRLQDPLAELVKVDPKSLGVGMYQHDLNPKVLEDSLNEVISECVSNVGVDLNTASHCLLQHLAGLTAKRAENIIQHRLQNGPFTNRHQLKDVKGIGEKIFEQCAGFSRIVPSDLNNRKEFYEKPETNPLDATWIHPESYDISEKIAEKFGLCYKNIGTPDFITTFKRNMMNTTIEKLADEFQSTESTINLIVACLSRPLDYDLRIENPSGPIFKKDITTFDDLTPNLIITGRVTNLTHFGAFVDVGVGRNGLIHNSKMNGLIVLLGNMVEVKILEIIKMKQEIRLELIRIM